MRVKRFVCMLIAVICITSFSGTILSYAKEKEARSVVYYKYYTDMTVTAGDTLWSIASEYAREDKISVSDYIEQIQAINNLNSSTIHPGDTLTIFYYSSEVK